MATKVNIVLMGLVVTLFCAVGFLSAVIIASNITTTSTAVTNSTESYTEKAAKSEASVSNGETNCSSEWEGFCLNEGTCVFKIDLNITTCRCVGEYGGERCEKYLWYHSRYNCTQVTFGDLGLVGLILIFLLAVALIVIILLTVLIFRYRVKLGEAKNKLQNPSLFYDYESYKYSNQSRCNPEMSAVSEEKNRFISRSAPTTLGRLSITLKDSPESKNKTNKDNNTNTINNSSSKSSDKPQFDFLKPAAKMTNGAEKTKSQVDKKNEKNGIDKRPKSETKA